MNIKDGYHELCHFNRGTENCVTFSVVTIATASLWLPYGWKTRLKWSGSFSLLVPKTTPSENVPHPNCVHLSCIPSQLHGHFIKTLWHYDSAQYTSLDFLIFFLTAFLPGNKQISRWKPCYTSVKYLRKYNFYGKWLKASAP